MEELDISGLKSTQKELSVDDMIRGIGRKATDNELIEYVNKGIYDEAIDLEVAFAKYSIQNS
ncbi:hypothetical protein ACFFGT_15450 [Mucilaginibacter angelicae]|uniref:Antitoxin VbhA domain-containing protein n=1 Tax=Mucilaginibacter angelicae TaxID=869718 RepID=A0ABV6L855_9SPHI